MIILTSDCSISVRPPLVPNDEKVFSMMVKEMEDKGEIKQRKADIELFNKVGIRIAASPS